MKSPARVESRSLQDMLAKLIQQNEDLKTMVLAQRDSRFVRPTLYLLQEFRLEVYGSASTTLVVRVEMEILQTKQWKRWSKVSPQAAQIRIRQGIPREVVLQSNSMTSTHANQRQAQ